MNKSENFLEIYPGKSNRKYLVEVWFYRELFWVLALRDIAVRYKQTILGVLWAILQPLLTMVILTIIFGKIAGFDSHEVVPYPLLVFSGSLMWQFISNGINLASSSVISNANLVSKVYFPRIIIPGSAIVVAMVDFILSCFILCLLFLWYGVTPTFRVLTLPIFFLMAVILILGPGLLFAALNVRYRDIRYAIPFLLQLGLYISPVGFTTSVVPEEWVFLYSMNPAVGVIDGFRWALFGGDLIFTKLSFYLSFTILLIIFLIGYSQFRKLEKNFADVI